MNAPVTLKAKRYMHVYTCMSCGMLAASERSDAITCSPACRVAWHRSEKRVRVLESLNSSFFKGVTVAMLARSAAMKELRPDLADRVMAGEEPETFRGEIWRAYWDRIERAVLMMEADK